MNEFEKSYIQAVTRKLEKRGLSDEEIEKEVNKIMGRDKLVTIPIDAPSTGLESKNWCDTCNSKGVRHKKDCPKSK